MKLYHYTARHLWPSINVEGINRGGVLVAFKDGEPVVRHGLIWLTVSDRFGDQEWADGPSIPYDRAAVRLQIEIPNDLRGDVIHWLDYCRRGKVSDEVAHLLNEFGGPQNWRLWHGAILREWIVGIEEKSRLYVPRRFRSAIEF